MITGSDVLMDGGVEMPALGLGVFQTPPDEVRASGLDRSEVFLEEISAFVSDTLLLQERSDRFGVVFTDMPGRLSC